MKRTLLPSVFLSPLLVVACGGSPPPPPAAAPVAAPTVGKEVPADTSPVAEPTDLVVTAHLAKPSQVEKVLGNWTSLPMPGADDVAGIVTDLDVGSLIDLDAPVDVAVAVEGHGKRLKPTFAVALGVKPGASPTASPRLKSTSLGGGIYKLERKGKVAQEGSDDDGDDDDNANYCEILPAAGPSAMRLVCGGSEGAIAELGPYLARTAPRASYSSDLHVEARLDPVRSTLEQARQLIPMLLGGAMGDKVKTQAVKDLAMAAFGDVVDAALDLDRLKLDMNLADPAATATFNVSFRDNKSFIVRSMTAHPERADAPPAAFWHLPSDAKAASFGHGVDAKDLEHPQALVVDALSKSLDEQGLAAADRQAVADAVQQTFGLFTSPWVQANGIDTPAAPTAKKDDKGEKKGDKKEARPDREQRLEDFAKSSWALYGFEQPFAKIGALAKNLPAVYHRPGVAKLFKSLMADGVPAPTLTSAPVNAKLGLPKDTVHLVLSVTMKAEDSPDEMAGPIGIVKATKDSKDTKGKGGKPAAPAKPKVKLEKPYLLHFYFIPDAGRTWLAYGSDETIVTNHAKVALSTAADPGVLQSRQGLDDLKNAKSSSAGFITMRGALAPSPFSPFFPTKDRDMERAFFRLQNTPQKGETPIPIMLRANAPAGQGAGSVDATLKVPRECIKDVMAAAINR